MGFMKYEQACNNLTNGRTVNEGWVTEYTGSQGVDSLHKNKLESFKVLAVLSCCFRTYSVYGGRSASIPGLPQILEL